MIMTPRLRTFALAAHVTCSVGWLGTVVAYLALAIAGLTSQDAQIVRASYLVMELIGWFVIVPFSLATLLTGLIQSLGTAWGLFRHYWIVVKLLLNIGATIILLLHIPTVSRMSDIAATTLFPSTDFAGLRIQLVLHAVGGLFVLLAATALSVYKPWGMTAYGRRMQRERGSAAQLISPQRLTTTPSNRDAPMADLPSPPDSHDTGVRPARIMITNRPWRLYMRLTIIGLVLLVVVLHLAGGGLRGH